VTGTTDEPSKPLLVILGNQLFPLEHLPSPKEVRVFMAEDLGLCTYVRHHQQKIVLFLAAMRSYADALQSAGYTVSFERLDTDSADSYETKLQKDLKSSDTSKLLHFEIEDKAMEQRLLDFAESQSLERTELRSPMFLCRREEFASFAKDSKRLLMGEFYKHQRRSLGLLVDDNGQPEGDKWSFDADNRKKLPKNVAPPSLDDVSQTKHVGDVVELVAREFLITPAMPGSFVGQQHGSKRCRGSTSLSSSGLNNLVPTKMPSHSARRRYFTAC
jgi:deoxyribodipyrimidine photolyase-related protein